MTVPAAPSDITIVGSGPCAMAFDGQERIAQGTLAEVSEAVVARLGITVEFCVMNEAILGTEAVPVNNTTLDRVLALIPAAEAITNAKKTARTAWEVANKAGASAIIAASSASVAAAEAELAIERAAKLAARAVEKAEAAAVAKAAAEAAEVSEA